METALRHTQAWALAAQDPWETGDGRPKTGDRRRETGDRRRETESTLVNSVFLSYFSLTSLELSNF